MHEALLLTIFMVVNQIMKHYCLGFLFDPVGNQVVLIQKEKPDWQKNKWNGVGGKVEPGELPIEAMQREFEEETGLRVCNWAHFSTFTGNDTEYNNPKLADEYAVHCFKCFSPHFKKVESKTSEFVLVHEVKSAGYNWLPNLHWLIPMALMSHIEHRNGGWFQVITRAEDQSPTKYTDTFKSFPKILSIEEILS